MTSVFQVFAFYTWLILFLRKCEFQLTFLPSKAFFFSCGYSCLIRYEYRIQFFFSYWINLQHIIFVFCFGIYFQQTCGCQIFFDNFTLLSNLLEITIDWKMLWVRGKWNMVMHGKGCCKSLVSITVLKFLITWY